MGKSSEVSHPLSVAQDNQVNHEHPQSQVSAARLVETLCNRDLTFREFYALAAQLKHTTASTFAFQEGDDTSNWPRPGRTPNKVRQAVRLLRQHAARHHRVSEEELSREVASDPAHLGRLLKRYTGCNFREARRAAAMSEAIAVLLIEDTAVAEASYAAGYLHPTQFTREFRELFGICPTRFKHLFARAEGGSTAA